MKRAAMWLLIVSLSVRFAWAQEERSARRGRAGGQAAATREEVYKTVDGAQLKMFIYEPRGHQASDRRPAIVFFFGGGWQSGSPGQFDPHCRYLADRGMLAMAADYRVYSRHKARVVDCVADAKSAIRWVRSNADRLGVDPGRIAAGGGSAGGHLAAAVATLERFDEPTEDASVSSRPDALLLFNPALDLTPEGFNTTPDAARYSGLARRLGGDARQLSPNHNVRAGAPPAIVFHGKADTTVPFVQAEAFAQAMNAAGNRCELAGYEGQAHGFFNFGRGDGGMFRDTLSKADAFLASLGYLSGQPGVEAAR